MVTNLELTAATQLDQAETYANEYGIPAQAIFAYWGNIGDEWDDIAEWIEDVQECYIGEVDGFNAHQWLGEQMEEIGAIDVEGTMGELRFYFDYEKYGRDLELGGDVWESDGYYFWNR